MILACRRARNGPLPGLFPLRGASIHPDATFELTMGRPSTLEIVILALAVVASLALFLLRLQPVAIALRKAKADPDYSIHPLWPRVQDFVWEVMLQGNVIKERPLPGIAHAFVFWGFLRLRTGHRSTILPKASASPSPRDSWLGPRLLRFCRCLRRDRRDLHRGPLRSALLHPAPLAGRQVSYESGFIAFLIFLLMVTYLAATSPCRGRPAPLAAARTRNWWLHTAALLIFLPLIPHTKHLHLVLSPFAIFTQTRRLQPYSATHGR